MTQHTTTYSDTITRLNAKSLRNALELISLFSCIEFVAGFDGPVSRLVNNQTVRLLADAVVKSRAAWYKKLTIAPGDLPTLINGAVNAQDDPRLQREVVSGGERREMLYGLQRFLARMAYLQIRPQKSPVIPLGQLLAIVDVLPAENWHELPQHAREPARQFPALAAEALGAPTADLLKTHLAAVDYFSILGRLVLDRLPRGGRTLSVDRQARVLSQLVAGPVGQLDYFRLTPAGFGQVYGGELAEQLEAYGAVFGRPIEEHRRLLEEPPYKVGPEGLRLSSLDRFPLVAEGSDHAWYAPNVRLLARAAADVIHYTLNEKCRRDYERVRGPLLELYLTKLLARRAETLTVIPEQKWPTARGEVGGPDLVVLDHGADPIAVGIEIKFRRMVPSTRFELSDEDLLTNYADLWKAMSKLPEKLQNVFAFAGGYEKYRAELTRASHYPRLHLGLAGEAPFMFGELTTYLASKASASSLQGLVEPWAVMTAEAFERLVEVVVQERRSLARVLAEYREDCAELELSGTMADDFRKVELDEEVTCAFRFLDRASPRRNPSP